MPKNAGLMSTIGAYYRGVYIKGLFGTADGIYSTVAHPIKTVEGLTDILVNPGMLVKAVKNYTNEKIIHGSSEDRAELLGHAAFEIGLAVVANGSAKSGKGAKKAIGSSKAADIADDVSDISNGSKTSSKISGIGDEIAGGSNIKQPSKIVYSSKAAEIGEQAGDIAGIDKKVSLIKQPSEIAKPNKAPIELPGHNKSPIEIPDSKNPTKLPDITDTPKMPEPKKQVDKVDDIAKEKPLSKEDVKHEDKKEVPKAIEGATAAGKSSVEFLYEKRGSKYYKNLKGTNFRISNQSKSKIDELIDLKLQSTNSGEVVEGKVAKYIRDNMSKELTYFSAEIDNLDDGNKVGDIDVMVGDQIIEVKKSLNSVKEKQIFKYTQDTDNLYFNFSDKKVVVFIYEKVDKVEYIINLENKYENKIKVINSFEELEEILK